MLLLVTMARLFASENIDATDCLDRERVRSCTSILPYDLTVDEWLDERRDFWKSTTASLEKLKYNQQLRSKLRGI